MKDFSKIENQLCFAIYETSSEFSKLYSKILHNFGLTYPQYLVLLSLWEKDGMTLKELGSKVGLGTGTLTPMIKRMEANGWLRKERSKADERSIHIFLEEKAQTEKAAITDKVVKVMISCNIEVEEYDLLMNQLLKLQKKLRNRNQVRM
ncbi:DNA-binding MarR family transcriptional regulator [Bacillus mesophilus]|uniref:HTH-type transcriptional regulator SarZ n=1 Tax=Bacillus mesophilus TaxID=1808955 RepID=A0A6M0QFH7_9BACI|nr:MarR family transcriptional regulator [Bacillus mesophilus]MBM7663493.1 DNA-binding MarR family transcriptional regulator [Bacillus mesophilus]NEY74158.1 MarR family transcriptional regulator [Bacillus mesophilus]